MSTWTDTVIDTALVPHSIVRMGIRRQLAQRLADVAAPDLATAFSRKQAYIRSHCADEAPIAIHMDKANSQHYEVGTSVLKGMLGPRMKYSSCLYPSGRESLGQAEVCMLEKYVERAGIEEGMRVLDLGCGWGSVTLFLAEKFPGVQVVGFSNSRTQRKYIVGEAKRKGLANVDVVTGDVGAFDFGTEEWRGRFDRVVSIEMFEHMKNHRLLLKKVAMCLRPGGKAFVHYFCHKDTPYDFEEGSGWMSEHFFTGGTMMSTDLLLWLQEDLKVGGMWWVNGRHYARTCEDWLMTMARNKEEVWKGLEETYGKEEARRWWARWEVFYMACAELFRWNSGEEWGVAHYLFEKPA